jgi:hypothetical protein
MKKSLPVVSILLIVVFAFSLNWAISNNKSPERELPKFDTRIDNIGYWMQMAEKGLTPYNPDIKPKPAVYTGSQINARSVATEDSPDVPVTEVVSTQSENSIFIDPNDEKTVLQSNNSTQQPVGSLYGANDLYSFDGAETWEGKVEGAGGKNSGDPTTAIGLNGRWYINYIASGGGQGASYSDDQGQTWIAKTVAPNPGQLADKNHMWIDNSPESPYEGNLYTAWTDFGGSNQGDIVLSKSTDDGETWDPIVNISSGAGGFNQGVHIQTGPNGEVYAFYSIYDGGGGMNAIGMSKSLDGGETWTTSRPIENLRGIREFTRVKTIRCNDFPVSACDISQGPDRGNLYVVWSNIGEPGINTGDDIDIYMIKSTDGGDTWSAHIRVNQNPLGEGKTHFFPWIACDAETGSLACVFYDDRNVSETDLEVFCANSKDAGDTWEDFKVSDVSFTPSPIPGLASGYMGDYLGITSKGGQVYPVFTDNRLGYCMTWCSPYEFNALRYPDNLTGVVTFETGVADLGWTFDDENAEGFLYFKIYRDGEMLTTTTDTTYADNLPDYGYYSYMVTAFYEEDKESNPGSIDLQWGDAHITLDPESIHERLTVDSTSVKYITVSNPGQLPLNYEISTFNPETKDGERAYCDAKGQGDAEYIKRVVLTSLNNESGSTQYTDFTALSVNVDAGSAYDMYVTVGNFFKQDQVGAWIDWDQNEIFDEDLVEFELFAETGDSAVFKASVNVPFEAIPGSTRMRVRLMYTGELEPCGTTIWGEVEDYTVNVQKWFSIDPLSGNIDAGESFDIAVNFSAMGVEPGMYGATAVFYSNDPEDDSLTVHLTLEVTETLVTASVNGVNEVCEGSPVSLTAIPYGDYENPSYMWTSVPEGFTSDEQNPTAFPILNTTYFVTMTSGTDEYMDSVAIATLPIPNVDLGSDTAYCGDATITLDAGPDGVKYMWSTGDTTRTIEVDTTTGFEGYGVRTIIAEVYNDQQCVKRDTIEVEFRNCTGIDENNISMKIYPNPNNGVFSVELEAIRDEIVTVSIISQQGAVVYQNENLKIKGAEKLTIDLGQQAAGIYQLFVKGKNSLISKKIVAK